MSDIPAPPPAPKKGTLHLLALHALATALLATFSVVIILPLVALRYFGAGEWQTFFITAAVPTLLSTSIFWHDLQRRLSLPRYLLVHWLAAAGPLVLMMFAQNVTQLLACHIGAAIGAAGWMPVNGMLLKQLYSDQRRGRAFGLLQAATLIAQAAAIGGAGWWLARRPDAFRLFLPAVAATYAGGLILVARLARTRPVQAPPAVGPLGWRETLRPVFRAREILAADPRFFRYEAAYMTYGCGFMICDALLPHLVTVKLHMPYDEAAGVAYALLRASMLVMILPAGWLSDRLGPIRTSAVAFLGLTLYPLLLLVARDSLGLGIASVVNGVAMAGVMMGWMLGPVSLARSAEQVSEYVAIHTTLVGLRGILFQFAAILGYTLTGTFTGPLLIAAAAFGWAAVQMFRLQSLAAEPAVAQPPAAPAPAAAAAVPETGTSFARENP